jgi:hypothetical protein
MTPQFSGLRGFCLERSIPECLQLLMLAQRFRDFPKHLTTIKLRFTQQLGQEIAIRRRSA